ncbi:hypothetical protein BDN71DRAFT_1459220 [Pleurotus eryngii]|uniref:Uncharacterized protein n=1 Tax=Pleurotus eryngii TaxID=5323 RepID=A0A9P5ZGD3_PLEER|nr:hypothetical protein BDN71DRAFT_1459220 [Pleurotus eryngii]
MGKVKRDEDEDEVCRIVILFHDSSCHTLAHLFRLGVVVPALPLDRNSAHQLISPLILADASRCTTFSLSCLVCPLRFMALVYRGLTALPLSYISDFLSKKILCNLLALDSDYHSRLVCSSLNYVNDSCTRPHADRQCLWHLFFRRVPPLLTSNFNVWRSEYISPERHLFHLSNLTLEFVTLFIFIHPN